MSLWSIPQLRPIKLRNQIYLDGDDGDAAADGTTAASTVVDIGNVGAVATTVGRATANLPAVLVWDSCKT